jgi:hypothetical protein
MEHREGHDEAEGKHEIVPGIEIFLMDFSRRDWSIEDDENEDDLDLSKNRFCSSIVLKKNYFN